ncbi:predicted protein, partial [Phaeodactylum tricornutum CCAP 1055/1]
QGPAGSGKSTYCQAMQEHATTLAGTRRRRIHVANLDPAAEIFQYDTAFDVRDLISVEEVMEELGLGPNGGLLYCMEYLVENLDWLHDELEMFEDDEYLILDCPGQLELYTHVPIMRRILDSMRIWGYESSMVSVFCVDAAFLIDASKFLSGSLLSLSAMVALELPHVNVLTKCDLMPREDVERILGYGKGEERHRHRRLEARRRQRNRLTDAIGQLLDDYAMVSFIPLNLNEEDSIEHVLATVDHAIQYGEDLEIRGAEEDDNNGNPDAH